jgi:hypothetical protein
MRPVGRILYTSEFGGYEKIFPPLNPTLSAQHLVMTDATKPVVGWQLGPIVRSDRGSARLANREQKMLFRMDHSQEIRSLYIDANVRPLRGLTQLFEEFEASGKDLAMYPHYARSSVQEEARACLARNKVENPEQVPIELAYYKDAGFPDTGGMWEGSVIFKNHASPRIVAAMNEWWELYARFQTRDQFSLPFIIWKHDLTVLNLDDQDFGRDHFFLRLQHSSAGLRNQLARYLQARAPESALWSAAYALGRSAKGSR